MDELSNKNQHFTNIKILLTPKYHCEISGEGVEYDWDVIKKNLEHSPV